MEVTLSAKYQVVIPKNIRRQLNLKPGQKMVVSNPKASSSIVINKKPSAEEIVDRYAGSLSELWQGEDAVKTVRQARNQEWD